MRPLSSTPSADEIARRLLHLIADWPPGTLEGQGLRTGPAAAYLGVSPNTIRSWEQRYGFPLPERRVGGYRFYNPAQLVLLKEALARVDGSIGGAMALLGADIARYRKCP